MNRIPAYPLITIDPYISIWKNTDLLYKGDTVLWTGAKKSMVGLITIDEIEYRFMGQGSTEIIPQKSVEVTTLITSYVFANDNVELKVQFWTPLLLDDLHLMSSPVSFIDYEIKSIDGKAHNIILDIFIDENFCFNKKRYVEGDVYEFNGNKIAHMSRFRERPLNKCGDNIAINWGHFYLLGKNSDFIDNKREKGLITTHLDEITEDKSISGFNVFAYDDIYSIEYFGEKLKGYWHNKFQTINDAIDYFYNNHDDLFNRVKIFDDRLRIDAVEKYNDNYYKLLSVAYRQVIAAHKLVEDKNGELLFMSKECFSNGCINTVDVSYPSMPLFLLYQPVLVKAMMNGIIRFARHKTWKFDFAPHDLGTYPLANGQVYATKGLVFLMQRYLKNFKIYRLHSEIYTKKRQMPIEESANMLIMAYAYLLASDDKKFINDNIDLFTLWADYLVSKGVILENQLCTDDFSGHSEKNVNLTIKSCVGIAAYSKILEKIENSNSGKYYKIAKDNANKLIELSAAGGKLAFTLSGKAGWSLKYNMIFDKIFHTELFDKSIYDNEIKFYKTVSNKYGVPLDYRNNYTKSDWLMWCSALDDNRSTTNDYSDAMALMLSKTEDRVPFTDWYNTLNARKEGFQHRSVQGGLWMPILKDKGIVKK